MDIGKHMARIEALVDRAERANAVACEADTPAKLRLRLAEEGWEEDEDYRDIYHQTDQPDWNPEVLRAIKVVSETDPGLAERMREWARADRRARGQPEAILVVRGRYAYQVLEKHVLATGPEEPQPPRERPKMPDPVEYHYQVPKRPPAPPPRRDPGRDDPMEG